MTLRFVANVRRRSRGKLADVELHFDEGPLSGLKLIGFGVWRGRQETAWRVTFPAVHYDVKGSRRSVALLRPIDDVKAAGFLRTAILSAFHRHPSTCTPLSRPCGSSGILGSVDA